MTDNAAREGNLQQWRDHLDARQREAAEEAPFGPFQSRMTVDLLRDLTTQEQERMRTHERAAFSRHQELAQAKHERRRAWVAAGGDAADFEAHWRMEGQDEHLAAKAREKQDEWRKSFGTL